MGTMYAILAAISFSIMAFLVSHYSHLYSAYEFAFFRCIINFLILTPFVWNKINLTFSSKSRNKRIFWLRVVSGGLGLLCYFYNLEKSSVGIAMGLFFTVPAFLAILGWVLLKERLSLVELFGITLTVGGAISAKSFASIEISNTVLMIGILGSFLASIAYLSLRKITNENYPPSLIVWGLSGFSTLVACIFIFAEANAINSLWDRFLTKESILVLLGVSIAGLLGQIFQTYTYLHLRAAIASSLGALTILFGVALQSIFGKVMPTTLEFMSYGMIALGIVTLQIKKK